MIIGSHVSFNKDEQLLGSARSAVELGESTFMFYTGAPQNTKRVLIDESLVCDAHRFMIENNIDKKNVIVHAPYIINLANEKNFDFSIGFLKEEINRVERLGFDKIVLHPGSHVGVGTDKAIENIIFCLNKVLVNTNVKILLETMAGKGTEVGINFEEIERIIKGVKSINNIGVCLDTCHVHDAGYDVSNFDKILDEFDEIIGLDKLLCIHLNDSKNAKGSHKDRHENIGYGQIGFQSIIDIVYNERVKDIPIILETPFVNNYPPYRFEIDMIKNKTFNENLYKDIENFYK